MLPRGQTCGLSLDPVQTRLDNWAGPLDDSGGDGPPEAPVEVPPPRQWPPQQLHHRAAAEELLLPPAGTMTPSEGTLLIVPGTPLDDQDAAGAGAKHTPERYTTTTSSTGRPPQPMPGHADHVAGQETAATDAVSPFSLEDGFDYDAVVLSDRLQARRS